MLDRLEIFTDDEIRAASKIILRSADYLWSQQVTGHWNAEQPSQSDTPLVAIIEPWEFDEAVERIRSLRSDVPGDLEFEP